MESASTVRSPDIWVSPITKKDVLSPAGATVKVWVSDQVVPSPTWNS